MTNRSYQVVIWEGWKIQDFIDELKEQIEMIMQGRSYIRPFLIVGELKKFCMDNQPCYKKYIPEVVNHFKNLHQIKGV